MRTTNSAGAGRHNINAILGVLGIFSLGIFLDWYPKVILGLPLPDDLVQRAAVNEGWQIAATIILPCLWAIHRLGLRWSDFGLNLQRVGVTLMYSCALYSLALAAFIHCASDPIIANHAIGNLPRGEAAQLITVMSLGAAATDIATRGFLLLTLARYGPVWFAVLIQNLTWYLGHIHEIEMLRGCLGFAGALGLTLTLGIVGDIIALKTRNVVGLAIAHILLNIVLMIYLRQI